MSTIRIKQKAQYRNVADEKKKKKQKQKQNKNNKKRFGTLMISKLSP